MKSIKVLAIGLLATLAFQGCTKAEAADVTVGYVNNNVMHKDGLRADIGTEHNNIRYGLTTFTSDDRLETYGVYGQLPIYIHNTNFAVTPQLRVEQHRDVSELVGSLGLGLEYKLAETVRVDAVAFVSEAADSDVNIDGETYMFGVTKSF